MTERVELLIAGAGLTGLLLALACAGAGLEVALVERREPHTMRGEEFDPRSSALALGSQRVLESLGLWPAIAGDAEPILEIRVADDNAPFFLHYDHRALPQAAPLGYIVENRVLRGALLDRARALPNLLFLAPVALAEVEIGAGAAFASLSDGRRIAARLLAAADGRGSMLRRAAHIGTIEWRYPQRAIVTAVAHARPHGGVAVEHFLAAGPFAILPMTGNRSSIVWTEAAALARHRLALAEPAFAAELGARFGDHLGAIEPIGARSSYPLSLMLATRTVGPRLALLGEAAHLIHPIAGQGLNLGIRDVAALAEIVIDARRLGLDIGESALLERYERSRRLDVLLLASVTDGLNRLFSNSTPALKLARDLGLAAVDRIPPLKRLFMRQAMGIAGELPRLVRGERL
jgi:2-octaprenyl-6-methoxyphenol hydroxylase